MPFQKGNKLASTHRKAVKKMSAKAREKLLLQKIRIQRLTFISREWPVLMAEYLRCVRRGDSDGQLKIYNDVIKQSIALFPKAANEKPEMESSEGPIRISLNLGDTGTMQNEQSAMPIRAAPIPDPAPRLEEPITENNQWGITVW